MVLYNAIIGMMLLEAILPTVTGRPDSVVGRVGESRKTSNLFIDCARPLLAHAFLLFHFLAVLQLGAHNQRCEVRLEVLYEEYLG